MGIKNTHANIDMGWVDHDHKGNIRTITIDGHELIISQLQEAQKTTLTSNGTYHGLFREVTVAVPDADVQTQEITVTSNGTYLPSPGKYISKVTVGVYDAGFAEEDIDWDELL